MEFLKFIDGTIEAEKIASVDKKYEEIQAKQSEWYKKSQFFCPDGCGECCRNFEPDLLECEALYMAAWLLENQPEVALKVAEGEYAFPNNKGCKFWDEKKAYHCTIYGGRPSICRMFGACGNKDKNNSIVFKPCKFYNTHKLALYNPALKHKQYSKKEIISIFGTVPPIMSDLMESIVSINPENHDTKLISETLPETIRKLLWLKNIINNQTS